MMRRERTNYNVEMVQRRFGQSTPNFQQVFHSFFDDDVQESFESGFEVFKNNPIFGVGNKNYRFETCEHIPNKDNNYVSNQLLVVDFISNQLLVANFK